MKKILFLLLTCSFSYAAEWKINSMTIAKNTFSKELQVYLGDLSVNLEIQNISSKAIKVATNFNAYLKTPDYHKYNGICCNAPIYEEIQPNQILKIGFGESSKNLDEKRSLYLYGEKGKIFVDQIKLNQPIELNNNK